MKRKSFYVPAGILVLSGFVFFNPAGRVSAAESAKVVQPALQSTGAPSYIDAKANPTEEKWDLTRLDQMSQQLEEQSREMSLKQQALIQARGRIAQDEDQLLRQLQHLAEERKRWNSQAGYRVQEIKNIKEELLQGGQELKRKEEEYLRSKNEFQNGRVQWEKERGEWEKWREKELGSIQDARALLKNGAAELDMNRTEINKERERLKRLEESLLEMQLAVENDRKQLDRQQAYFEQLKAEHQAKVNTFKEAQNRWEETVMQTEQTLLEQKRQLEIERKELEQQQTFWQSDRENQLRTIKHSQAELDHRFETLELEKSKIAKAHEEIQRSWAVIRQAETELEGMKTSVMVANEREKERLSEWEKYLRHKEKFLEEKERMFTLREQRVDAGPPEQWISMTPAAEGEKANAAKKPKAAAGQDAGSPFKSTQSFLPNTPE